MTVIPNAPVSNAPGSNATTQYPQLLLYIDGGFTAGSGTRGDDVIDPATGAVLGRVPFAEPVDVDRAIAAARRAFPGWRDLGPDGRAPILRRAAAPPRCCASAPPTSAGS